MAGPRAAVALGGRPGARRAAARGRCAVPRLGGDRIGAQWRHLARRARLGRRLACGRGRHHHAPAFIRTRRISSPPGHISLTARRKPIVSLSYHNPQRTARSAALYPKACEVIPAGVNSTARARFSGWDPYPLFIDHGTGAHLFDVDGNRYVDYLLGLGPMLLGHRPPGVTAAVVRAIQERGTVFALPTEDEARLAHLIIDSIPSVEQVRLCNTGTEAVIYALRLARTFTGRQKIIRFEGMYHGFADGVYWSKHPDLREAGPDDRPVPVPQGPGIPACIGEQLIILPWNDVGALRAAIEREGDNIAAVLTEAVMCNTGCILPEPGYLEAMRELTAARGILLIFDEVITGFRLHLAGAQGRYNIRPDLSVFAKGLGGGFPVAALGGRKDIMSLAADGTVSIAGTYTANTIAVAAALAALEELRAPQMYQQLNTRCERLYSGLEQIFQDARMPAYVVGVGPVMQVWFAERAIRNYRDAIRHASHTRFRRWWEGMLNRGVLFHPHAFENLFVSFAHSDDDVAATLDAAKATVADMKAHG
ncbi:MAG: glutamate-1-semialdehyde 2,1-aminomutase [Proteobacteria bacterium]|nr:glutamate-1-semialdehyde 2,1-aminomutase [Pseudomonadota bacterium]